MLIETGRNAGLMLTKVCYFAILQSMETTDKAVRPRRDYKGGANVFKALGHPTRLLIVDHLSGGEQCVADLTKLAGCDISTVSNHLAVLRNAGLLLDERRGQQVFYRLGAPCVANVFHCLEELRAAREKQP
jgi:ArsR family transcriptional regulator